MVHPYSWFLVLLRNSSGVKDYSKSSIRDNMAVIILEYKSEPREVPVDPGYTIRGVGEIKREVLM